MLFGVKRVMYKKLNSFPYFPFNSCPPISFFCEKPTEQMLKKNWIKNNTNTSIYLIDWGFVDPTDSHSNGKTMSTVVMGISAIIYFSLKTAISMYAMHVRQWRRFMTSHMPLPRVANDRLRCLCIFIIELIKVRVNCVKL